MKINICNLDCLPVMKQMQDNEFDLAIVDPPYGINWTKTIDYSEKQKVKQLNRGYKIYKKKDWDIYPPPKEYWDMLFRISKNQIVFGAVYFANILPISKGWIFWDKMTNFTAIQNELIWTSFNKGLTSFKRVSGRDKGIFADHKIFHPTTKPVQLYKWLLKNYTKPTDKIIDTHLGSGSIAIACLDYGMELTAFEIDKEYYEAAMKRINIYKTRTKGFFNERTIN